MNRVGFIISSTTGPYDSCLTPVSKESICKGFEQDYLLKIPPHMLPNKRFAEWASSERSSKRADRKSTSQPLSSRPNVPSTSSPINVLQPEIAMHERALLSTLKGSMRFLQKNCRVFPPLQSAVGTLLEVLEPMKTSGETSQILREMASDLPQWASVLSGYMTDSQPERMSRWIERLSQDLMGHAEYIRAQQQRGKLRQLAESKQDMQELEKYYRGIEASFRQLQTDTGLNTWKIADDHLKDSRLSTLFPAHDARYDSIFSDKIGRGGCFQNTRVSVLEEIRSWIHGRSNVRIYCLNGMAGTGKTTIAYSVCDELKRCGRLGASFFCSRASPECRNIGRILPTIAYQLAQQFYPFRSSLCRILGEESDIGQRNVSVQFEYLIHAPLLEVGDMLPDGLVVVIDALDECSEPETMGPMLAALFRYTVNLPIRFFLTGRPEPLLINSILSQDNHSRLILHLHSVEEHFVKADIETYLTTKLAILSLNRTQIKQLADQAGILFIYAATVARYLLATTYGANISARLAAVLAGSTSPSNKDREIDSLYKAILSVVFTEERLEQGEIDLIKRVLWTVVCVREPVTIGTIAALLKLDSKQVSQAIQPLRSVVHVSEGSDVVSTLHASFPEFIFSWQRCGLSLYCDQAAHSSYLAIRCFKLMKRQLRFNICGLETSNRFDKDIPDLKSRTESTISSELFYACRFWVDHLRNSSFSNKILAFLGGFLHRRLLFWMEVLNLKGWMGIGPKTLAEVHSWLLNKGGGPNIRRFVHDARNFVITFASNPVRWSTPHIYVSALPLLPRRSTTWDSYGIRARAASWVDGTLMDQRQGATLAVWNVGCEVTTVAYSPDGTRIVSGSQDGLVRVWDVHNGDLLGSPLMGHTDVISSVAFSSDGRYIASGSCDSTIRVWDARSGASLGASPFRGHVDAVSSVAFSADGERIASGSWDCTIQLWDVYSGAPLGNPLEGHSEEVFSVSFSPNGTKIVSGSSDGTILMWDAISGTLLGRLPGDHGDEVFSVAFSADSTRIISGSNDCTIRMWDARRGTFLRSLSEGLDNGVRSVAFSPDNNQIVSGSSDSTIRLWDLRRVPLTCGLFEGHTDEVSSVSFSPDGTHIVSGSSDGTIRIWDVQSSTPVGNSFEGHAGVITSVAFSPDNTRIVSGSRDHTVRLWDARDGDPVGNILEGHTSAVSSVAYSPDGSRVASGSWDCTIRIWDIRNNTQVGIPLEGHTRLVSAVAFSPNGSVIVSGSSDRTVRVWDALNGTVLGVPFEGHNGPVTSVAFSPDGTRIISGSLDRTVQIWDLSNDSSIGSLFESGAGEVLSVAFSPDGTRIASGHEDFQIRIWHAQSNTLIGNPLKGHTADVMCVEFSPDGARIVSGSSDHTIRIWDVQTGVLIGQPLEGHTKTVTSVSFSSDGARIVSGSEDRTIRVWDAHNGVELGNPSEPHINASEAKLYSPSDTLIVSNPMGADDASRTNAGDRSGLRLDDQGWVFSSSGAPLFWHPTELRDIFPKLPSILTIYPHGSVRVNLDHPSLGESWHQHYNLPHVDT